jgi:peptidoglycan hydrolase-like protein with peptidoglycan-binding domain
MDKIRSSVGEGGRNNRQDVGIVQFLLNVVRRRDGAVPLAIDGIVGPKTLAAIREFQEGNSLIVDGRVDPDNATIRLLNAMAPQHHCNNGITYLPQRRGGGLVT